MPEEGISKPNPAEQGLDPALDDESDVAADKTVKYQLRGFGTVGRAHSMNDAAPHRDCRNIMKIAVISIASLQIGPRDDR